MGNFHLCTGISMVQQDCSSHSWLILAHGFSSLTSFLRFCNLGSSSNSSSSMTPLTALFPWIQHYMPVHSIGLMCGLHVMLASVWFLKWATKSSNAKPMAAVNLFSEKTCWSSKLTESGSPFWCTRLPTITKNYIVYYVHLSWWMRTQ